MRDLTDSEAKKVRLYTQFESKGVWMDEDGRTHICPACLAILNKSFKRPSIKHMCKSNRGSFAAFDKINGDLVWENGGPKV